PKSNNIATRGIARILSGNVDVRLSAFRGKRSRRPNVAIATCHAAERPGDVLAVFLRSCFFEWACRGTNCMSGNDWQHEVLRSVGDFSRLDKLFDSRLNFVAALVEAQVLGENTRFDGAIVGLVDVSENRRGEVLH